MGTVGLCISTLHSHSSLVDTFFDKAFRQILNPYFLSRLGGEPRKYTCFMASKSGVDCTWHNGAQVV